MKNQLYYGDNLEILRNFVADESVDLCYIDPPFNSDENYNQTYATKDRKDVAQAQAFIDTWTWDSKAIQGFAAIQSNENGVCTPEVIHLMEGFRLVLSNNKSLLAYLVAMTQRIAEIYRVLKPTGSFYLHCDPTASHYLKLVCDALFCSEGRMGVFQNEIKWTRSFQHNLASKRYDNVIDVLLFYTRNPTKYTFNRTFIPITEAEMLDKFSYTEAETGRKFNHQKLEKKSNFQSKDEVRIIQGREVRTNLGWVWSQATFDERLAENPHLIHWTSNGKPRYKIYQDEYEGKLLTNDWHDIKGLTSRAAESLGYPTQKPEALLERIIRASSNENDVVLDAFCGCGTTIAVAEKMNRKWIGIDVTYQAISLILKRLEDTFGFDFAKGVIDKEKQVKVPPRLDLYGIPKDLAGYRALAMNPEDKARKEFEKLVILQYSNNRAMIHEKKGADRGVDGIGFITHDLDRKSKTVIFSAKSGNVNVSQIRDLRGVIERENAAIGFLISLETPSRNMYEEAKIAGVYESKYLDRSFDRLQIITVQDIIDGKRLELPMALEVVKSAELNKKDNTENLF